MQIVFRPLKRWLCKTAIWRPGIALSVTHRQPAFKLIMWHAKSRTTKSIPGLYNIVLCLLARFGCQKCFVDPWFKSQSCGFWIFISTLFWQWWQEDNNWSSAGQISISLLCLWDTYKWNGNLGEKWYLVIRNFDVGNFLLWNCYAICWQNRWRVWKISSCEFLKNRPETRKTTIVPKKSLQLDVTMLGA